MSFEGKVVIVTGAASGIGAATALKFNEEGARIVLVDINEDSLLKFAAAFKNSLAVCADITNDEDVSKIINETIKEFNCIDILVNCAGVAIHGSILEGDLMKSYTESLNVNLRGPIHLTKLAAPYLIKQKGNIVNISSVAPHKVSVSTKFSMYSVSKAGLNTFTVFAAAELAPFGVRVNAISPGTVKTNLTLNCGFSFEQMKSAAALKRYSEPEEIADLVLYLASEKAKGITGTNILADNGQLINY